MTIAFGYVRVSTAKQGEGVSLSEQRDSIARYARQHGLSITSWFEEKETAAKRGRPVFTEVLKRLRKGEADSLIVHKIDRSARNLRDWADLGELMDQGVEVHFAHESLDLSSRGGRLSADLQAVIAADYIRNLSEETKKGHRGRLKQGIYPFPAPIGYLNTGPGKVKDIDPVRGPLVRSAFELYATGEFSLASLSDELHRRGLRTSGGRRVHKPFLGEILHNPFYAGTMRIKLTGDTYPGKHTPLITRALFDSVQARLAGKRVKSWCRHEHLFRRLFTCGLCGRSLVPEKQKGRVYYRCQGRGCPTKTVREDVIAQRVKALLLPLRFNDQEMQYLEEGIRKRRATCHDDAREAAATLERDLGNLQARLTRFATAYVDGDLDRDTFTTTKEALLAEKRQKEGQLAEQRANPAAYLDRAAKALELAQSPLLTYEKGIPNEKRDLLRELTSNRTLTGKELSVELRFPFSEMVFSPYVLNVCPPRNKSRTNEGNSCRSRQVYSGHHRTRTPEQLDSILQTLVNWAKELEDAAKSGS